MHGAGDSSALYRSSKSADSSGDPNSLSESLPLPSFGTLRVSSMQLINFMCHANLVLSFEKQVTCIVGENGSGKSAVMVALGLLFGVRAGAMRGGSFRQYIKTGEDAGAVRADLALDGSLVCRIEKRIFRDAPTRLRITDSSGRILGKTQEDLAVISESFRINLNNPLCFLTQDQSKQLVRAATPRGMYSFFKAASDLQDTEILHCRTQESLSTTKQALEQAGDTAKHKRLELQTVRTALEVHTAHAEIESRMSRLQKERPWALLQEKEKQKHIRDVHREKMYSVFADISKEREHILESIKKEQEKLEALDAERQRKEALALNTVLALQEEAKKDRAREREIEQEIVYYESEIKKKQANIQRLDRILGISHSVSGQSPLDLLGAERETQLRFSETAQKKSTQLEILRIETQQALDTLHDEIRGINARIKHKRDLLATSKDRNPLHFYGSGMELAVRTIREKGLGAIGPLGCSVKVKTQKWARAVEALLGSTLSGFIVGSMRQKRELELILQRAGVSKYQIYVTGVRNPGAILRAARIAAAGIKARSVSCSKSLTTPKMDSSVPLSTISVLEENFPQVRSLLDELEETPAEILEELVVLVGVERIGLVERREVGYSILKNSGYDALYTPEADKIQYIGKSLSDMRPVLRDRRLLSSPEWGREIQRDIDASTRKMNEQLESQVLLQQKLARIRREREENAVNLQRALTALAESEADIQRHMELLSDDAAVEREKETREMAQMLKLKQSLVETLQDVKLSIQKVEEKVQQEKEKAVSTTARARREDTGTQQLQAQLKLAEARTSELRCKIEEAETGLDILQKECIAGREEALAASQNTVVIPSSDLASIDAQLARMGAQMYVLAEQAGDIQSLGAAEEKLHLEIEKLEVIIGENRKQVEDIEAWTEKRVSRREQLRDALSDSVSLAFSRLMSLRDYNGQLKFDHESEELEITVSVVEHSTGNKNTLSGGERSFAGICLLLSLWPATSSPIRVLDEFDVFMDGLNRKAALHLLFSEARKTPAQIILITPLGVVGAPGDICEVLTLKKD